MKKIVFLLGSPRGTSTCTEAIADYLIAQLEGYEAEKWRAHEIFKDADRTASFIDAVRSAERLVLCSPVFVHSLPWPFQELLTAIADAPDQGGLADTKVMAVIHSGYIEPIQRQTCFEICANFCCETGMVYQGGIGFGASPLIGAKPLEETGWLMKWPRRALQEMTLCINTGREVSARAKKLVRKHFALFPRRLLIMMMNMKVKGDARKAGIDYAAQPYGNKTEKAAADA
jgi:hypothetical protein